MNNKSKSNRIWYALTVLILASFACQWLPVSIPSRSDMPIRGDLVASYTITQPAGSERVENVMTLRGTGDTGIPPFALLTTEFFAQPGLKSQNISLGSEQILGMTKPERGIGWTRFAEFEPATQCTHDAFGAAQCGTKVRIKFMQNAIQHIEGTQWDYDALLYYTFPATWISGNNYQYDPSEGVLISATINQVTQFRLGWGPSWFHNWGHSVVVVGGEPAKLEYGFWRNTEQTEGSYNDIHDAVLMLSDAVKDLGTSSDPWLEFATGGRFNDSTVIYSAGDADQYANADRILLNRQRQYAMFYRPDAFTAWDWVTVVPSYNFEFNDFDQIWSENILDGILNKDGTVKSGQANNADIRELEKIGCQNCPNASLEQVSFYDSEGELLYSITFRAYIGADQTLVIFGPEMPSNWSFAGAPTPPSLSRPIDYNIDDNGNKTEKPADQQTFSDDASWKKYVSEATIWEWLRIENPLNADLFLQFQVTDSTEWAPIPCSDGGTCGYRPVRWNLEANYYFDGDTETPWLISQLLGEVGMRTLGFSYVSGRYEGSGIEFALDQPTFYQWHAEGFPNEEVVFMFDARALTTPEMLKLGWEALQGQP